MADAQWKKVANESDLKEGVPVAAKAGKDKILLVRLDGQIHAVGNQCPHYGAKLSDGAVVGHSVTCPWHGARFDVTTGRLEAAPALDHLAKYPVKIENGAVYVGEPKKTKFPKIEGTDERAFVIVGGGAAGNAAAETLRREGFAGRILLLTAEADRPYDRPNLTKEYLTGEAKPEWMPLRSEKFYGLRQIELRTHARVTAVSPSERTVTLDGGEAVAFDALLLATGAAPRALDIPGMGLEGCFLLRSMADGRALTAAAAEASKAVVLGASFIGLEVAASLRQLGIEVHVVAPEAVPMARVFGERVGTRIQSLHEEQGVVFHLGQTAKEILGDGKVEAAAFSDGSRVDADLVVTGIGVVPVVDYLEGTGLVEDGAVPVDGRLRTKAEGIFAAGDIAVVPNARTGEPERIEHWVVAERQGQHAARAMLGSDAAYAEVPFFWTKQYDASIKYVGHARSYDRIAYRGDVDGGKFLAGYFQGGSLKAAASLGMGKEIIVLAEVLKAGTALSPEQLEHEATALAELLPRG